MRRHQAALFAAALVLSACQPGQVPDHAANPAGLAATEANAEFELSNRLMNGAGVSRDPAAGAAILERLAGKGNANAQAVIGEYYLAGLGVERRPETAAGWLQKAADQNNAFAQVSLAYLYMRGVGVKQDYARAMQLATAAAERGDAGGENALGVIYQNGFGVARDDKLAITWFRKAGDRRFAAAMINLGAAYRDGKGVPADKVFAYAWYSLAAGNARNPSERELADRELEHLALLLLPADVSLARQLAADWKPGTGFVERRHATADKPAAAGEGGKSDTVAASGNAPGVAAAPAALKGSIVYRVWDDRVDVQPDGGWSLRRHVEMQAQNEASAAKIGEQPIYYVSSRNEVEVLDAYTLKTNGKKLPVEMSAVHTQMLPSVPDVSTFDDRRQKVIVFPNVAAGDVVAYTVKITSRAEIPGAFTYSGVMNRTLVYGDLHITLSVPKSKPLVTETHDMRFEKHSSGDRDVYEWHYSNASVAPDYKMALDPIDVWPRFYASSFPSYEQFARTYAALVEPKMAVTAGIRALAEEIVAGVGDRRTQAERIYDWVSRHIRYVGVEIGDGAYVPRDAEAVLQSGYGDCKDHVALLAALLKAKGIQSEFVLINAGASYSLGGPPTFLALNHAIAWLPEFKVYVDTTAGVAPFGVLPFGEYGKPVVHASSTAPALHRTPILPAGAASIAMRTTARLDGDGRITGESETTATGPFAIGIRQLAIVIERTGAEQAAAYQLRAVGSEGSGKFEFSPPYDQARTYRLGGHFQSNPRSDYLSGNSFGLPIGLATGWRPGDELLGPLDFLDVRGNEPTPCYNGREVQDLSLELPPGKHVRELPKDREISNPYIAYKSHWAISGQVVSVHRELTTTVDQAVCIGEARRLTAGALNEIRRDYNSGVISLSGN